MFSQVFIRMTKSAFVSISLVASRYFPILMRCLPPFFTVHFQMNRIKNHFFRIHKNKSPAVKRTLKCMQMKILRK